MSNPLKLMALDTEDLLVLSAHVQDGVLKSGEIEYQSATGNLIIPLNRFAWELPSAQRLFFKKFERRRSILHVSKVRSIRSTALDRDDEDEVQSLLSLDFVGGEGPQDPSGNIELNFGGEAKIIAAVECIEVRLTDMGAAWAASSKPQHHV